MIVGGLFGMTNSPNSVDIRLQLQQYDNVLFHFLYLLSNTQCHHYLYSIFC